MGMEQRARIARKIAKRIDAGRITVEDLIDAGLGVLMRSIEDERPKQFERVRRRGAKLGFYFVDTEIDDPEIDDPEIDDPEIDDLGPAAEDGAVDEAAGASGEPPGVTAGGDDRPTGIAHRGGGWYDVLVDGVSVERVRGAAAARERFTTLQRSDE